MGFADRGFSCKRVVEGGNPILSVYHETDGAWQFLCGGDEHADDDEILVLHPAHLLERDPTLRALVNLPIGYAATRLSREASWERSEITDEDGDEEELSPEERIPMYRAHLERHPRDAAIWFDLGLAYKQMRNWQECVAANLQALEISNAPEDPAWWNLGIAATGLRDWELARRAWRGYGIEIADGPGPVECDYGSTPVRLNDEEVVWGPRLDPARVIIRNIPLPKSGFRWGDIVLHDGAPNGEREVEGVVYSVFDVLERWSPSEIPTLGVRVNCSDEDARALIDLFESRNFGAEDWSNNVRNLCKACSQGLPSGHDHPFGSGAGERSFGLASPMGLAGDLLKTWKQQSPSTRSYEGLAFAE